MRRLSLLCCAAVLIGCAKSDQQSAADTTAAAGMMETPVMISLAEVAGRWTMRTMPEVGDSTLVTYELAATADTAGWSMTFAGRPTPVPVHVMSVAGDSIVTHAGPYESALRRGVQVTVDGVYRLQAGQLVGTFVAHYATTSADSVLRGRFAGSRAQ